MSRHKGFPKTIYGISPLGGSFKDPSDGTISGVPLFYDLHTDQYQSEQAIEEQDDREISIARKEATLDEEEFRAKAGFTKS
jgi:hypothetical protein